MKKTLGILGGMGPLATADLYRKIVLLTRADSDNEHIRVYIDGNARIPDRTAAILSGGADPMPEMRSSLRHLELCGADCIIMPCNTAHYYLPRLQAETEIPFISMLTETAKTCARAHPGETACILATRGTLASGLYENALSKEGVSFFLPGEGQRDVLMYAIYDCVKGGRPLDAAREPMKGLLRDLRAKGADYFVLGCTELPIAVRELALEGPFVDSTVELAKAAIRCCGYEVNE